jgi:hypothetical protein
MKTEMRKEFLANILGSNEVQELLMVNRSRLSALVEAGKLTPVKELKASSLFWLPEVEKLKKEMSLDPRTNLYKKGMVKN